MTTRRWFGTDGIRGTVGQAPMTPDFVLKLGWALGMVLRKSQPHPTVVIGKDTRLSGYMLESALEAGLSAAGARCLLLGPIPTPAVSSLTTTFRAQAGIVVSASHNPYGDNGIKFFGADGYKLADAQEAEIEQLLDQPISCVAPDQFGKAKRIEDARGRYVESCKATYQGASLEGMKIALDCANGAAYQVAPLILEELGADLLVVGAQPDGVNINRDCGSTAPEILCQGVLEHEADIGIALDGDADRCVLVDAGGRLIDGDAILYVLAIARQTRSELSGPVVGTLMSNFGLERALHAAGIAFERAAVGDRYVLERMRETSAVIGGEPSGHILVRDRARTGDGMVAALQILAEMSRSGQALRSLCEGLEYLPQFLLNVPCGSANAKSLMTHPLVVAAMDAAERKLQDAGRMLLRPSGTEPLIRVMAEATDEALARACADEVVEAVRTAAAS